MLEFLHTKTGKSEASKKTALIAAITPFCTGVLGHFSDSIFGKIVDMILESFSINISYYNLMLLVEIIFFVLLFLGVTYVLYSIQKKTKRPPEREFIRL